MFQNGMTDNDFMDFDESPAQSVGGLEGLAVLGKHDGNTDVA